MKSIYITRHGESINNSLSVIGGDCDLTDKGKEYGFKLRDFFSSFSTLDVWTSSLIRTRKTAECIGFPYIKHTNLDEINAGDFDGMVLTNIKNLFPIEYKKRNGDKLNNCYPNGESYKDLYKRVYSVIDKIDLESTIPLLIICHKAVFRVIYSILTKINLKKCTELKIPLHQLFSGFDTKIINILKI